MARGALRGAGAAWLGLIALQTLTSGDSSSKVGGAFGWLASVFDRALDPKVAAIPDHGKATSSSSSTAGTATAGPPSPYFGGMTPAQFQGAVGTAGALSTPQAQAALSQGLVGNLANLNLQGLANLAALNGSTPTR